MKTKEDPLGEILHDLNQQAFWRGAVVCQFLSKSSSLAQRTTPIAKEHPAALLDHKSFTPDALSRKPFYKNQTFYTKKSCTVKTFHQKLLHQKPLPLTLKMIEEKKLITPASFCHRSLLQQKTSFASKTFQEPLAFIRPWARSQGHEDMTMVTMTGTSPGRDSIMTGDGKQRHNMTGTSLGHERNMTGRRPGQGHSSPACAAPAALSMKDPKGINNLSNPLHKPPLSLNKNNLLFMPIFPKTPSKSHSIHPEIQLCRERKCLWYREIISRNRIHFAFGTDTTKPSSIRSSAISCFATGKNRCQKCKKSCSDWRFRLSVTCVQIKKYDEICVCNVYKSL